MDFTQEDASTSYFVKSIHIKLFSSTISICENFLQNNFTHTDYGNKVAVSQEKIRLTAVLFYVRVGMLMEYGSNKKGKENESYKHRK